MASKAIFINFEFKVRRPGRKSRPKGIIQELNGVWAGLSADARTALTAKIKAAENAAARTAEQNVTANAARQAFETPGQSLFDFQQSYLHAKEEFKHLHADAFRSADAWKALEDEYKLHAELAQATKDAIANKLATAQDHLTDIDTTQDELDDFNDTKMPVPLDPNGERKVMEDYLSDRRKEAVRHNVARKAAKNQESGINNRDPERRWEAWNQIGEGGNGLAWVWVCFDKDDKIIKKAVRKDTDYSVQWDDIRWWTGKEIRDYTNRVPWEHKCHQRMTNTAKSRHTVYMMVDWRPSLVDPVTQTHRLYTAWSFAGDLWSLIEQYKEEEGPDRVIPEPMIWATAEALARAGLAMARGTEDPTAVSPERWKEIVHRDLKPQNIFLTNRDERDLYRGTNYPRFVLGDFGLGFTTDENDARNPESFLGMGTTGFIAPEVIEYVNFDTLARMSPHRLNEKTNVWGMGAILWSMVTLQDGPKGSPDWMGPNPEADTTYRMNDDDGDPYVDTNAYRYTPELRNFIDQCMSHDPAARPDFAGMLNVIHGIGDDDEDRPPDDAEDKDINEKWVKWHTKQMRLGQAKLETRKHYGLRNEDGTFWGKKDGYKIGLERSVLQMDTPRDKELREVLDGEAEDGDEENGDEDGMEGVEQSHDGSPSSLSSSDDDDDDDHDQPVRPSHSTVRLRSGRQLWPEGDLNDEQLARHLQSEEYSVELPSQQQQGQQNDQPAETDEAFARRVEAAIQAEAEAEARRNQEGHHASPTDEDLFDAFD